ncbi:MAG: recombinase family protein [Bacteroidia bacterium]
MKSKEILYIYIRVSTSEQAERDLSMPRQKELGIKLANELGMAYKIFAESGESASQENFDNRPQLFEILRLVKEGVIKHLFVFDQTRLSRNNITKAIISESLKKQKVNLYTHSKRFDFTKSEDELTFKILEAIETYETSMRKARFKLGYVTANKKGRYLKGIPPYGYKKDNEGFLIVDEEEKAVFLTIVDLYLTKDYGTNQIANYLNEKSIPTKTSKVFKNGYTLKKGVKNRRREKHVSKNEWNPGSINTMLQNELYYGKRRFKISEDNFEYVACEPIIDKETFDKIQAMRVRNAIMKKKEDKYFYLLKDLITCGHCGSPLHGRVKINRGENTYRCNSKRLPNSTCKSRGINITKLNDIVWNAFKSSVFYHKVINQKVLLQLDDDDGLNKRLKDLQTELTAIEKDETKAENKLKKFIKKYLDTRIAKKVYDELYLELESEAKLLSDNKAACQSNIKMITQQLHKKQGVKSEYFKGMSMLSSSKEDVDSVYPPKTKEDEAAARKYLRESISNITVTFVSEKGKYVVEIVFHKVGIKKEFADEEPYKFEDVKKRVFEVGVNEGPRFTKIKLPPISTEYFLNADPVFREKYENERLELLKTSDSKALKVGPPLYVQQEMSHL